ncbi:hypothetical protein BB050_03890 [Flavobacterium anhuiense]|uniref:Uncharacterized protein n=1 Tax=Flavobacterium anhuiense TaxID=459526 RepID=A0AAC9GJZ1_9FLAO|nr:hypothetical protein BB050_03890 [Flavobacterium anhuiense]
MILISAAGSYSGAIGLIIPPQADLMQEPALLLQLVSTCIAMKYAA